MDDVGQTQITLGRETPAGSGQKEVIKVASGLTPMTIILLNDRRPKGRRYRLILEFTLSASASGLPTLLVVAISP